MTSREKPGVCAAELAYSRAERRQEVAGALHLWAVAAVVAAFVLPWVPVPRGIFLGAVLPGAAVTLGLGAVAVVRGRQVGGYVTLAAVVALAALAWFQLGPALKCLDDDYASRDFEDAVRCEQVGWP